MGPTAGDWPPPDPRFPTPRRYPRFWRIGAAFWALDFAALTIRLLNAEVEWGAALGLASVDALSWALLSLAILTLATRTAGTRGSLARNAFGVGALALVRLLAVWRLSSLWAPSPVWWALLQLPSNLLGAAGLLTIVHAMRFFDWQLRRERAALTLQAQLSEAELRMLQMQMQPHFLFNALNSISALMRQSVAAADRMLTQLGGLLRLSLERTQRETVTLREEMEFLELYLAIEQTRYHDRLSVRFDVASAALEFPVPHLILQPLVENAIRHGIAPHPLPADLLITARIGADGRLHVEIRDGGAGLPPGPPRKGGMGIAATRARLEQRYGGQASFAIVSSSGAGTRVTLALPELPAASGTPPSGASVPADDRATNDQYSSPLLQPDADPRGLRWYVRRFGPSYLALWAAISILQVLLLLGVSGMGYMSIRPAHALQGALISYGLWPLVGAPALLYAARWPIRAPAWLRTTLANLAVAMATVLAYAAIGVISAPGSRFIDQLINDLPFTSVVACSIVGLGHLAYYWEKLRRTEMGASRLRAQLSEAELRMLQMTMQPHFLFDALNSISALMRQSVAAADRMLAQLGGLLRLSLERTQREMVSLREELEFLELYLAIERTRSQDRLSVRFDVADATLDFPVPTLILQPLVEDAIRHSAPSHLLVAATVGEDARLHLEVRDWGGEVLAEGPAPVGPGIAATRARLQQRYGAGAGCEVASTADGGTRVVLELPRRPE